MATTTHRIRTSDRARHEKLAQLLSQQGAILRNRRHLLRDSLPNPASGVLDDEEHSLGAEEQDVGFTLLELTSQTVQAIETALQRLTAGGSDQCSDCWTRIGGSRLRALPFAALCLACQDKHDSAVVRVAGHATAH